MGEHVVPRLLAALGDVASERVLEEGQRVTGDVAPLFLEPIELAVEPGAESGHVIFRNAQEVSDHQAGERRCVLATELDLAVIDELVDLLVGEPPHEVLVLLHLLRREEPPHQTPVVVVLRADPSSP